MPSMLVFIVVLTAPCPFTVRCMRDRLNMQEKLAIHGAHFKKINKGDPRSAALLAASENFVQRECVLKLLGHYTEDLTPDNKSNALAGAKEKLTQKSSSGQHPLLSATIEEEDGIDSETYPACTVGSNAIKCAETLPPHLWLEQRWELEDVLEANEQQWYCPWCKVHGDVDKTNITEKKNLYSMAVKKTGFSTTRAWAHCQKATNLPDVDVIRSCVEEKAALGNSTELVPVLKELWASDDKLIGLKIQRPDFFEGRYVLNNRLFSGGKRRKRLELQAKVDEAKARLKEISPTFDVDVAQESCKTTLTPGLKTQMMMRSVEELITVCNETKNEVGVKCSEKEGTFCPEGHAPDIQRKDTPNRAKAAFVFGMTPPGWLASWAVGCGLGFVAMGPPGCGAGVSAVVALPDPLLASFYYAAFRKSWTSTCQCFQHECTYDKESQQCSMKPSSSARNSSNPFTSLPPSGLACVLSEKSAVTGGRMCEIRACHKDEVASPGPYLSAEQSLFGLVGRSKVAEGHSEALYNCPSTGGTLETQFAALSELPTPSGANHVENTALTRSDLLTMYEPRI